MIPAPTQLFSTATVLLASGGPLLGKAAFISVFLLLLNWLAMMPAGLLGQTDGRPPWWRDTRFWAVVVVDVQILAYLCWG